MSSDPPHNRCGYNPDVTLIHENIPQITCYRPVWNDRDRCVWHAREAGKSITDLKELKPNPGEHLDGAYLEGAKLRDVDWFSDVSLVNVDFTRADVRATDFSGAQLRFSRFEYTNAIYADFSGSDLEGTIMSDTDLRSATLVETRLNGAIFSDVYMNRDTDFGEYSVYETEATPETLYETHPLQAAAWVYRELQEIYHDNSLPTLNRHSYQREKDARRRLAWKKGEYGNAIKYELSRWIMLYGTSPYRILTASIILMLLCGVLYPLAGGVRITGDGGSTTYTFDHVQTAPLSWIVEVLLQSIYFSVVTFSTLGYGDIKPVGYWAQLLSGIEAILGTLFAALLVFVLARSATW
ncbi:pentapeptide repeat-containing protein [Halocatena salina]|uniref:Pentapeptide repeat-containing protein n=1 Tax=Halocatena salina TaxID=2934340 RepID=A0A8U0A730_9EURY|nr:pentapeptide repeat-containing protein [Halocatena salina]UPM45001.1 pentapeptide repeat-containing protein [Halocatena salina]